MRRNMRPPPREEGRIISECQPIIIIIIRSFVRRTMSASELNLRRRPIRRITVYASAVSAMFNRAFAALFCQIKDVVILLSVLPNVT